MNNLTRTDWSALGHPNKRLIDANTRHMAALEVALTIVGNKGVRALLGRSISQLRESNEALQKED